MGTPIKNQDRKQNRMTRKEKILYHQIHPLKLLTDVSTGFFTTYLLWYHNITWFLILFLAPSVVVTLLLMRYADLERLKNSVFGRYIEKYMNSKIEAIRFIGQIVMWVAAWFHFAFLIAVGLLIIIAAWCNGLVLRKDGGTPGA